MSMLKLVLVASVIITTSLLDTAKSVAQEPSLPLPSHPNSAALRINFRFDGPRPTIKPLVTHSDAFCATCNVPNESLLIGKNGELENVVLIWDEKLNRNYLPRIFEQPKSKQVEFEFEGCRLTPRIAIARVGQEVVVRNKDNTGHVINLMLLNSSPSGAIENPNNPTPIKLTASEPTAMPVRCGAHPWEQAHIIIKDHPYVAFSNATGSLEIKDLPVGKNWFRIWHESTKQPISKIDWNGEQTHLQRGRIEFDLKAGDNDLGTILINAEQFSAGD